MENVRTLHTNYESPDYPVSVEFIEVTQESLKPFWEYYEDEAAILVVNYGTVGIELEDDEYQIVSGQACLINMAVAYKIKALNKTISYYMLRFKPEFIIEREYSGQIARPFYDAIDNKDNFRVVQLDENNLRDETVLDKINAIIAVNHTKKPGYEIATRGYLCHLWVALLELLLHKQGSFKAVNLPTQDEIRVKMAIDYMKEHFADEMTLDDIARRIHISRSECCRCFKRVIGVPPIDFLIKLRVYEAAKLIYKDPLAFQSFSDLSFAVGFNTVSYFNKMFKRTLELTPTEFQRQLRLDSKSVKKLFNSLENVINQY